MWFWQEIWDVIEEWNTLTRDNLFEDRNQGKLNKQMSLKIFSAANMVA